MTRDSTHLSIVVDRSSTVVYEFAADPANLPAWASGLARTTVEWSDGHWVAESPMGRVTIDFTERNDLGVLDHVVTLPAGQTVFNPLRVIPYGESSEVVFTLRRQPGMTEEELTRDATAVRADLASLKRVLEGR
ncbi:MAG: SRPBCC family protein [Ornithinimicrobium sp.]